MSLSGQSALFLPVSARVSVLRARGLRIKGKDGTNDAYVSLQAGRETFRTPVLERRAEPVWGDQGGTFICTVPPDGGALQVRVLHRVPLGVDKVLGLTVINLHELRTHSGDNQQWYKLLNKAGRADKERGEVLLDIQFLKSSTSVSMIDLSDKSHSRLGKFKDKLKGKKRDGLSDSASATLPSVTPVLTDSEGDGEGGGESPKKKKNKLKSLFGSKSNLQRNVSQSMSALGTLPDRNSSLSSSTSSGLNVEPHQGKKKFKFLTHKRNSSTDSKTSNQSGSFLGSSNQNSLQQVSICINSSHFNEGEPETQDVPEDEGDEDEERWREEEEEEERLMMEQKRKTEEEEEEREAEELRREMEEQRRKNEEERKRKEREAEEQRKLMEEEENERLRMEREKIEQKKMEEERRKKEAEERRRMEEEDQMRTLKEERRKKEEKEAEEQRIRMEREKEDQIRKLEEERKKEEAEEMRRMEEKRIMMKKEKLEEERRWKEEKEAEEQRMAREKEEEKRKAKEKRKRTEEEEKERRRMEREKLEKERRKKEAEEQTRMEEEDLRRAHEKEKEEKEKERKRRTAEEEGAREEKIKNEQRRKTEKEERRTEEEQERAEESPSARISSIKPSVSAVTSQTSLVNTNPFLEDDEDSDDLESSGGSFKKRRAPSPPARNLQTPRSDDSFIKTSEAPHEETNQHLSFKESKRRAPQPPGGVKITNQDSVREDPGHGEGGTGGVRNDVQANVKQNRFHDEQPDTNPFTSDPPTSTKPTKGPAPKPGGTSSVLKHGPSETIIHHDRDVTSTSNPTSKGSRSSSAERPCSTSADGSTKAEHHLKKVLDLDSVNPEAPFGLDQDFHPDSHLSKTESFITLNSAKPQKRSQAPGPPAKPKRTEEPDLPEQQPQITENQRDQKNWDKDQEHKSETPSSSPASSLSFSSRTEMKPAASVSGDAGSSGSGFRNLSWVEVEPGDAGEVKAGVPPAPVIRTASL
ncbi:calponin homology domain-containing protein DDB_G0272472 isoform X2 [Trichomycterus rosablanca]|uniref:calponin homology domain-containing protein DDB_G0272472 isoform X2 n=1 Tax=Trichomycterus rosablanca TaxID=2290929 RepID=UPI002F35AA56